MPANAALHINPEAKFFIRTPRGRKGVKLPAGTPEDQVAALAVDQVDAEAHTHGWAALDRVETRPILHIIHDVPAQAPARKGAPKKA